MLSRTLIPLADLKAEIVERPVQGQKLKFLVFDCPGRHLDPDDPHKLEIPFSDTGLSVYDDTGKLTHLVWIQLGERTLEKITLSPSFRNRGACEIHGYVRNGTWEFCE